MNVILFFTYGISLKDWESSGLLSREIEFYKELSKKYNIKFTFVTYGNSDDLKFVNLIEDLEIIPIYDLIKYSKNKYLRFLKSIILPFYLKKNISNDFKIIKTNQLNGSWVPIIFKIITGFSLYIRTGYDLYSFSKYDKKNKVKQYFYFFLTFIASRVADVYSVTSKSDMKFLKKRFKFNQNNIVLIPNWINIKNETKKIEDRENNVVCVGRLEKQKNYKFLIESLKNTKFNVNIFGDGSEKMELYRLIEDCNNIHFKGTIENFELLNEYNNHKYFISLSTYEGNSKAILEAMASGCVVIASKIENNVELIEHFKNGVLFDLELDNLVDVMHKIDSDHDLQKKLSKNSTKRVQENNSLKIILDKEYEIYTNISKY